MLNDKACVGCNLSGLGGGVLGPETLPGCLFPQSVARPLS
jgi:hypothetical protein